MYSSLEKILERQLIIPGLYNIFRLLQRFLQLWKLSRATRKPYVVQARRTVYFFAYLEKHINQGFDLNHKYKDLNQIQNIQGR